jgi:uncharacterized membrane protein YfcA
MQLLAMPWSEIVPLALALAAAGLVTGFLAGLLGIGGGGVLVPILFETFGLLGVPEEVRMHMVLGTSFAIIVPTTWRSFTSHRARGATDLAVLKRIGPFIVAGVVAGVLLVSVVSGTILKCLWIVCATTLAAKMALGREDWRLGETLPSTRAIDAAAFAIGVVSTLMSIGGGMFVVTLLTLYGMPLLNAVATSSGVGPLIAIPGALGYMWAGWGDPLTPPLSLGYVSVIGALLVIPTSVIAAPFGVRAAHGMSRRTLELAFAAFLALVALRLLVSLF